MQKGLQQKHHLFHTLWPNPLPGTNSKFAPETLALVSDDPFLLGQKTCWQVIFLKETPIKCSTSGVTNERFFFPRPTSSRNSVFASILGLFCYIDVSPLVEIEWVLVLNEDELQMYE